MDYAICCFEILILEGFADNINIVTNGTVIPTEKSKKYLVYSPICIGDMIKSKGRILTKDEVCGIKNVKHRNITISPIDMNLRANICDRIGVCGIQYSVYGFSYTAACFPAMYVSQRNHKRFLKYLPKDINMFFDPDFEKDVCSICVSAIENYRSIISIDPQKQDLRYTGLAWQTLINQNSELFKEPDTTWINNWKKEQV